MGAFVDLTGQRFGRLTVIHVAANKTNTGNYQWICCCDCGAEITATSNNLRNGHTKSCGCFEKERISEVQTTHGQSHKRLYNVWTNMKQRCYNPRNKYYKDYGGRGIQVCEEWRHDYQAFHDWAYANGYNDKASKYECTIDRIDNNGDYTPSNCRFVGMTEQRHNRRDSRKKVR